MDLVDDPTGILARIDAATVANLCGCGCGSQIPADGESPDFLNEAHQINWIKLRQPAGFRPERPDWEPCDMPECDGTHRYTTTVTIDTTRKQRTSTLRRAIDRIRGVIR